jgi:hypothetical protein
MCLYRSIPIGPYSYINTCSLPPGILFPKTLKMGQTSDPETLVIHQKMTPDNNQEDFKQHLGTQLYMEWCGQCFILRAHDASQ